MIPRIRYFFVPSALMVCTLFALLISACSGSGSNSASSTASSMGMVSTSLSDPATCAAPDGQFSHVYVTITDVQANTSATASSSDNGWVDLTPNLSNAPKQVDLLGQANNQCFLASLGDNVQLQAGSYQQIRLILANNSLSLSGNACGSAANCVVLTSDGSVHALQLSSEAQTGIKIPSGQIASGGLNIKAGQTADLDIDFNTCASIVEQGNGQFRLKPVLHAGEVSTTSSSINGKVLDAVTGNPVQGAASVSLEQKDASGVDRVIMSTMVASDGTFVFCPLPAGSYDVVVVATRADGTVYSPAIVTGTATGTTTGTIALHAPTVAAPTSTATIHGLITSQNSSMAGTIADIQLSTLETVNSTLYTIPLPPTATQQAATLSLETAASTGTALCPTGTDCSSYSLQTASGGVYIGSWSASGATLAQSAPVASYVLDAQAFVQSSGGTPDCSPSELQSSAYALTGSGPYAVAASNLTFTSCQ